MAKTKEEIKAYVLSQNWGKMWIKNIELHSNRTVSIPNNLDGHLEEMFNRFKYALQNWIRCNAVKTNLTKEGTLYWDKVNNSYRNWYNT